MVTLRGAKVEFQKFREHSGLANASSRDCTKEGLWGRYSRVASGPVVWFRRRCHATDYESAAVRVDHLHRRESFLLRGR